MVEKLPGLGRNTGPVGETGDRRLVPTPGRSDVGPLPERGRPGNRWPTARQLAALIVNGFLRIPDRYRRGMYLDILV